MTKRQFIPYGLLLIAFLIWIYLKPQEESKVTTEHHPSYIAYNLNNTHFDETGKITHQTYATKATSYSDSDKEITIFENPKVILNIVNKEDESITTWQVSSKKGVLSGDNELLLSDDVWVRNLSLDQLVQTMNTEELTILLAEKELSSKLLVHWQGPQMKQQGVGMWASLVSEELIIKKQVKAVYLNEKK
jgi:lipopolysaccharide export system protein LptC